jgi:hypothetical protein
LISRQATDREAAVKDDITIADDGTSREPAKTYGEEEAVAISKEFLQLIQGFCDKYQAALIGGLMFSRDDDTNAMLFVMQGAFPERAEVDRALAKILLETQAFYETHDESA